MGSFLTNSKEKMDRITGDLPFKAGDRVVAMVNGMGATPLMELYVIYNEVESYLAGKGIAVARPMVGEYMTSLEMAGFSITLLRADDELLSLFDHPCAAPAWRQA